MIFVPAIVYTALIFCCYSGNFGCPHSLANEAANFGLPSWIANNLQVRQKFSSENANVVRVHRVDLMFAFPFEQVNLALAFFLFYAVYYIFLDFFAGVRLALFQNC
jgi:hypothetical protein